MPSGKTHDHITFIFSPIAGAMTIPKAFELANPNIPLIMAASCFFAGYMFGPDLDIHSDPYKRWGLARFIWLPYRKLVGKHRSFWSHGMCVGTLLRLVYLGAIPAAAIAAAIYFNKLPVTQEQLLMLAAQYKVELITALIGLELGAASHYLPDWFDTRRKKWFRKKKRSSSLSALKKRND